MRALLDHQITVEDLLLAVSLLFNLIACIALIVALDVRFADWKRRRAWEREQTAQRENIRNPVYGIRRSGGDPA